MHKLGYPVFPPRFQSMKSLTLRALRIAKKLKDRKIHVIEVHPTSTRKALGIPTKNWERIQEILLQLGCKGDIEKRTLTPHEIDAITAAFTADLHRNGKTKLVGDPIIIVEKAVKKAQTLSQKPLFIGRSLIEELLTEETKKPAAPATPISTTPLKTKKTAFHPYAKEIDSDIKVIQDPTKEACTTGSIEDYLKYFRDRFRRLEKILRRRIDIKGAMPISEALKAPRNSKVKVIGILTEKRESKQRIFFKIEDMNASATVFVPQNIEEKIRAKAQMLLLDQVVCVMAVKGRNDLLVLEDVLPVLGWYSKGFSS